MKWSVVGNIAWITLAVYLLYLLVFAVFPYFKPKKLSREFQEEVDQYDFYGVRPCVDRVALVEDPLISLGTRIRLLSEAQNTIDIAYYALHMGETTDYFLSSILDAAERGVKVRFLVDGMFHGFTRQYRHLADALGSHENIEIRCYNPVNLLKPWTMNGRMHDKYMIIDDSLVLLGGRNIGDKYFGPEGFDRTLSIDRDVLIYNTAHGTDDRSSALFEVRRYMESVWNSEHTKPAFHQHSRRSEAEKQRMEQVSAQLRREHEALFTRPLDLENRTFPANKVTFFANDICIGKKEPKVGYIIRELAASATDKVFLQSPYVVLSDNIRTSLEEIGKTDVDYEILTNSMQSSPNFPAYSLYLNDKQKILDTGAKIYEFQDDNAIHAKTYIIDDRMSIIGSFNLDPRSEYIDTEIMVAIDSEEFTADLNRIVDCYKSHSLTVNPEGKYIPNPEIEQFPVSKAKKGLFRVLGKLLSPLRVLI